MLFSSMFHLDPTEEEHQRSMNGIRVSASSQDVHRGDDFLKKLLFYEKNGSNTNQDSNPFLNSANSSRRSSFHQPSSSPSNTKTLNGLMNRQPQTNVNRPNLAVNNHDERMQRSKSSKDLFEPPSLNQPVYFQSAIPSTNPSNYFYSGTNMASNTSNSNPSNMGPTLIEQPRQLSSTINLISDDISSSSTGHMPKPPPGNPSQNAR